MSPRSPQVHMHEDNCNIGNHPHTVPCRHIVQGYKHAPALVVLDNKEQLDALPVDSVVRDAVKDKWDKLEADRWGFPAGQPTVFVNSHILARAWGPVTVVEVGA